MKKGPLSEIFMSVEPPQRLREAISLRLSQLERARARVRLAIFGSLSAVSAVLLIPMLQYTIAQFYASGFASYASLLISDRALVMTYWQEFALTLAESLPSIALLIMIPIIVALVWALRQVLRTAPAAFRMGRAF